MEYAYFAIAAWFIIVLTHGLTLSYATRPVIKQEVVEVRYMPQQSKLMSFKHEFSIDDREMMRRYSPDELKIFRDRCMREAINRLWDDMPQDMYEFYEIEDYLKREKVYGIKVNILPPNKDFSFNGEYFEKKRYV